MADQAHLIIPAQLDQLGNLRDFILRVGKRHRFSDRFTNVFKLAIDEAATNIIEHAYADGEGYITIQTSVKKNRLTVKLIDQGAYFDPNWVKPVDIQHKIDLGQKKGLGVFMIRKIIDEIDYQKTQSGNELTLVKIEKLKKSRFSLAHVATEPPATTVKYAMPIVAAVTILVMSVFFNYYRRADNKVGAEYIAAGSKISRQIARELSLVSQEALNGPDGILYINSTILPIHDERIGQVYSISLEDEMGTIQWSTISTELLMEFERPPQATQLAEGVYKYSAKDGMEVYEFTNPIGRRDVESNYATVHVLLSQEYARGLVTSIRLDYLKTTLIILGLSYVLLALSIYLMMYPIRKLSKWVKAQRRGDVDNEMSLNSSTEVGEIAEAFSEITQRFKESQKNLAKQDRLEKEIDVAKEIQESLLPKKLPELDSYEIAICYEAARSVGGDYYDFIEIDEHTIGIVIADVAGKGLPGSLVMTMVRTAIRTEARGIRDAAEVLKNVNSFIGKDIKKGMFVTVLYLIIDTQKHQLNFASAGHTPLILFRGGWDKTYYLNPIGYPIGVSLPQEGLFNKYVKSETIQLTPSDTLLIYTDGVTDAMNSRREMFGEERLFKIIQSSGELSLSTFAERLKTSIYSFTEGYAQFDDITFVAIRSTFSEKEDHFTDLALSVDEKFLSIEDITKILDVLFDHPGFDEIDISKALDTERYGFTQITVNKVRAELLRRRLHTPHLRQQYISICKKQKRSSNPPGTPKLILDSPAGEGSFTDTGEVKSTDSRVTDNSSFADANVTSADDTKTQQQKQAEVPQESLVQNLIKRVLKRRKNKSRNTHHPKSEESPEDLSKPIMGNASEDISDDLIDSILDSHAIIEQPVELEPAGQKAADCQETDGPALGVENADKHNDSIGVSERSGEQTAEKPENGRPHETLDSEFHLMETEADAIFNPLFDEISIFSPKQSSQISSKSPIENLLSPAKGDDDTPPGPTPNRTKVDPRATVLPFERTKEPPRDVDQTPVPTGSNGGNGEPPPDDREVEESLLPQASNDAIIQIKSRFEELTEVEADSIFDPLFEEIRLPEASLRPEPRSNQVDSPPTADAPEAIRPSEPSDLGKDQKNKRKTSRATKPEKVIAKGKKSKRRKMAGKTAPIDRFDEKISAVKSGGADIDESGPTIPPKENTKEESSKAKRKTQPALVPKAPPEESSDLGAHIDLAQKASPKFSNESGAPDPETSLTDMELAGGPSLKALSMQRQPQVESPDDLAESTAEPLGSPSAPKDELQRELGLKALDTADQEKAPTTGKDASEATTESIVGSRAEHDRKDRTVNGERETEVKPLPGQQQKPKEPRKASGKYFEETRLPEADLRPKPRSNKVDSPHKADAPEAIRPSEPSDPGKDQKKKRKTSRATKPEKVNAKGIKKSKRGKMAGKTAPKAAAASIMGTGTEHIGEHRTVDVEREMAVNPVPGRRQKPKVPRVKDKPSGKSTAGQESVVNEEQETAESNGDVVQSPETSAKIHGSPAARRPAIETTGFSAVSPPKESQAVEASEASPTLDESLPLVPGPSREGGPAQQRDDDSKLVPEEPLVTGERARPDEHESNLNRQAAAPTVQKDNEPSQELATDAAEESSTAANSDHLLEEVNTNVDAAEEIFLLEQHTFDQKINRRLNEDLREVDKRATSGGAAEESSKNEKIEEAPAERNEIASATRVGRRDEPAAETATADDSGGSSAHVKGTTEPIHDETKAGDSAQEVDETAPEGPAKDSWTGTSAVGALASDEVNALDKLSFVENSDDDHEWSVSDLPDAVGNDLADIGESEILPAGEQSIPAQDATDALGSAQSGTDVPKSDTTRTSLETELQNLLFPPPNDARDETGLESIEPSVDAEPTGARAEQALSTLVHLDRDRPDKGDLEGLDAVTEIQQSLRELPGRDDQHPDPDSGTKERETIDVDEQRFDEHLMAGLKSYKRGDYEDAIIAFNQLIKLNPDYKETFMLLGNAYFRNDMLTEALHSYEQLKKYFGVDVTVNENMAVLYVKLGILQLAVKEWQNILKLEPERPDIIDKIAEAERLLEAQRTDTPKIPAAGSRASSAAGGQKQERADDQSVNGPHTPEAAASAEMPEVISEALAKYQIQDYPNAINLFKEAIATYPELTDLSRYLGNTLYRNDNFKEARDVYDKLRQHYSHSAANYENQALVYAKEGELEKAIRSWKQVIRLNPNRKDIESKIAHLSKLL